MLQTTFAPFGSGDPFAEMRQMQSAVNRLFDSTSAPDRPSTFPPVNFWAGQDSIVMTAELPGLTDGDIELTVKDAMLSIRGTYPEPETADNLVWHRRERSAGAFLRSVELPFRIDPNRIEARFQNGVLMVEMQRPEEDKPKRIQIKAS